MAGKDWFTGFMHRNADLSVRMADATSLAKISRFNKNNADIFRNKLEIVLNRYKFSASDYII